VATDLGTLGGEYSFANAINEAGEVAGWGQLAETDAYHAALWSVPTVTDLGTLGGINSAANAINSAGVVVGWAATADNIQHAALWNGATIADLNNLLDAGTANTGWVLVAANGINDRGWIVGDAINTQTHQFRGFLLTPTPEPETYMLFLAGLGLIAFFIRHVSRA
jgi:probable HAF family extracellular repeat protein